MNTKHQWTDEERAIIRRDYRHTKKSAHQIAGYLSRITGENITFFAVCGQISSMGLGRMNDRRRWTPEEEELLAELMPRFGARLVAQRMHRSLNSVVIKSNRLKILRRCRNGWFNKKEVADILGRDHHWVQARIDSGAIRATYHHGQRPGHDGGRIWHIEEKDLKAYIRRYPEDLVGCNINIIMLVDILAGVTNNNH